MNVWIEKRLLGSFLIAAAIAVLILCTPAEARVTKILIDSRVPAFRNQSFGAVGPYEILRGRAFGEVDPRDPRNAIVQDIVLAPRTARGTVEYIATFTLLKPIHPERGNGVLFYELPNRGSRGLLSNFNIGGDPGDGFFYKHGYTILFSGWQGDLTPPPTVNNSAASIPLETINVPRVKNSNGLPVTGPYLVRITTLGPSGPTGNLAKLDQGRAGLLSYPLATLDTREASLSKAPAETLNGTDQGTRQQIPSNDWMWSDCATGHTATESTEPSNLCIRLLKGTFDPERVYTVTFVVKDPLVLGLGLAATRDIVSFFRYAEHDDAGNINPIFGTVAHVVGQGISQSGNFVKSFIALGFNEDESGRIVWDAANAHIAGRFAPINFRFAIPGGSATLYAAGSEAVLWWGSARDEAHHRGTSSMLDRCQATNTCPKIFETFGSSEFWNQHMSLGLVGTGAKRDIPLPANVRRYYFPGTTHGGGEGGFEIGNWSLSSSSSPTEEWAGPSEENSEKPNSCLLPFNPNPEKESMRALILALTSWVVDRNEPPPSQYPTLSAGQLTADTRSSLHFPQIPGIPEPYGLLNPILDYDFGPQFNAADMSGFINNEPPIIRRILPTLVPKVTLMVTKFPECRQYCIRRPWAHISGGT